MQPIDTASTSFEDLIGRNCLYVDKTAYLYRLITSGSQYYCFRPHGFGKSLTLSTLEVIFQGRRELFRSLAIDSMDYDWKAYPIVHIDFSSCDSTDARMLEAWLDEAIRDHAEKYHVEISPEGTSAGRFSRLLNALGKDGQVVVLVDEYEKVISDQVYSPEVDGMRQVLGNFYQVVKAKEPIIRFAFITGVTKYAKMSVFSRLNNLRDITMEEDYSTMFGYTQREVEQYFKEYIDKGIASIGMDRECYLDRLKRQYDGYCFCDGCETVYNPVSIGLFFCGGGKRFLNYWIDTGESQLVMDVAKKVGFDLGMDLENPVDRSYLGTFDILSLRGSVVTDEELLSLLEQTGYLTISPKTPLGSQLIWLDFPNDEVRVAFTFKLLAAKGVGTLSNLSRLRATLLLSAAEGNVKQFAVGIESLFAQIPYELHIRDERYYHSVFLSFMMALGAKVEGEKSVAGGRVDAVLEMPSHLYVIEFKRDKDAALAVGQILERRYGDGWRHLEGGKAIHLIGINVDTKTRKVTATEEPTA